MSEPRPTGAPPPSQEAAEVDLKSAAEKVSDELRYRHFSPLFKGIVALLISLAIVIAINQLFNLRLLGVTVLENRYLYLLAGIFLAVTFLAFPAFKSSGLGRVQPLDIVFALASLIACGYFVWTGERSLSEGWEYAAPVEARVIAIVLWVLILEATRRTAGPIVFGMVFVFSLYPVFADLMPGPIAGKPQPFVDAIVFHIVSSESSFGIPMKAFGELVIGFIIFGAALQHTGGGKFFNDLALALVGHYRGGAAKVAILASGFMGSISGSVISNVLTTGVVSIPAMKRTGFSPRYAAGTEACASTGGVLMPPVMGTTAFVMASFIGRPYAEIALAAAIPSILYYLGLFIQLDSYAARQGLRGMDRSELPRLGQAFAEGWHYIAVFALLVYVMIGLRQETLAPFYATALLLAIDLVLRIVRREGVSLARYVDLVVSIGRGLAELAAILLGVGLIIGAFSATGLAGTLVNDLVFIAGNNILALLVMGAVTSFIFGMGMTVTACYVFLAVVLAPALVKAGLDIVAVHLFILYWGMISFITPPVALGAFAAATLAGTSPMKAGFAAMRLGSIIYFVPFFFVLNPALIGRGATGEIVVVLATAIVGVWLLASALQGYVVGFGAFGTRLMDTAMRGLLFVGGLFFAAPGNIGLGLGHLGMSLIGLMLALPPLLYVRVRGVVPPARA
ncbi:MAG: TRAP transporter fused permease subunit [Hyphomicrobiaceae bacterium]|nr:TRAP transporter fused permease subunit [Hyphomicrobiaceae bacterium]